MSLAKEFAARRGTTASDFPTGRWPLSCSPRATSRCQDWSLTTTSDRPTERGWRVRVGFPSWQCGFDSRHPLHARIPLQQNRIRGYLFSAEPVFRSSPGPLWATLIHTLALALQLLRTLSLFRYVIRFSGSSNVARGESPRIRGRV